MSRIKLPPSAPSAPPAPQTEAKSSRRAKFTSPNGKIVVTAGSTRGGKASSKSASTSSVADRLANEFGLPPATPATPRTFTLITDSDKENPEPGQS